ncbi:hypothetical protein F5144DRAFT_490671 [Chaetomium tenue]|uniref:Uncharacterized protein n=1 Tax=Chaetomium tenue TaxID=1854479 RepID=A0ACB7P739_9PEZI|nr:hypothetical protein F5144DRAFT_490671 [Chaetomium globosum]
MALSARLSPVPDKSVQHNFEESAEAEVGLAIACRNESNPTLATRRAHAGTKVRFGKFRRPRRSGHTIDHQIDRGEALCYTYPQCFYPAPARQCLYDAADSSKCESKTVAETNACFCRNGGDFITTAAACIGQESKGNLRTVYRTMRDACDTSDTPINVTEGEFMDAAEGTSSTTSSATSASNTGAWPKKDWGGSPDPRMSDPRISGHSGFNWESPSHLAFPNAALAPSPPVPIQELDGSHQFRPGSTEAPAEMGGTPVVTTPPLANSQFPQPYHSGQQYPGQGWNQPQP